MAADVKPIRTEADHAAALSEFEQLWDAPVGSPEGDRLDVLATLIDAYENEHFPMDPPDPVSAIEFRMDQLGAPGSTATVPARTPPAGAGT